MLSPFISLHVIALHIHCSLFSHLENVCRRVNLTKLFFMHFYPALYYFLTRLKNVCLSTSSSSPLARQPMVGPGILKKLCPFVSVEGDPLPILDLPLKSFNPLQCCPWQLSPAFSSPDFVTMFFKTRWGCEPHAQPPAILEDWCFSVGVVSLSWPALI